MTFEEEERERLNEYYRLNKYNIWRDLNKAHQCNDEACDCCNPDNLLRHCSVCRQLYFWNILKPTMPCCVCQDSARRENDSI